MLNFKRSIFPILMMCAVILCISFAADEELPPLDITTSSGSRHTIATFADAERKWGIFEGKLTTARSELTGLKLDLNIIQMGIDGEVEKLEKIKASAKTFMVAGKQYGGAVFVGIIIDLFNAGNTYELNLKKINKYAEIASKNVDIATAFSDREKFYAEYVKRWEHKHGPNNSAEQRTNEGSLASMQESIPPLAVYCGGGCGDWWYDINHAESYMGRPRGRGVFLFELIDSAKSHETTCKGCREDYWTCNTIQDKKHELLYCGKPIEYYMHDSLSGTWAYFSVGQCGDSYRGCDDPKKKISHQYSAVMLGGTDSFGNQGYYVASYKGNPPTAHGKGSDTAPSVSINGPNGVGVDENRIDKTPNCDTCMDGSRFCPNASTRHEIVNAQPPSPSPPDNSPPEMHPCGVHEAWQSGDHSWITPACGIALHAGYACQITDNHKNAVICPRDSFNNACEHGSYYPCFAHEHVYPTPVIPPQEETCANGHSYDPTNTEENNNHRTRTCRWCSQTWQKCVSAAPQCLVKTNRKCWAIE